MVRELMAFDLDNYKTLANGNLSDANITVELNWAMRLLAKKSFLYDPAISFNKQADVQTYNLRPNLTTVSSGTASATQTVGSTAGMSAGSSVYFVTAAAFRTVSSVTNTTVFIANSSVTTTTGEVVLAGNFTKRGFWVHNVILGGTPVKDYMGTEPGLYTVEQLDRTYTDWRTAANGTANTAAQFDRSLVLYPKPNAAGSNNFIAARYMPNDLSLGTDIPDMPIELHEIIATLAVVKAAEPQVSEAEGWERLKRYDASMVEQVAMCAELSYQGVFGSLKGFDRFLARSVQA